MPEPPKPPDSPVPPPPPLAAPPPAPPPPPPPPVVDAGDDRIWSVEPPVELASNYAHVGRRRQKQGLPIAVLALLAIGGVSIGVGAFMAFKHFGIQSDETASQIAASEEKPNAAASPNASKAAANNAKRPGTISAPEPAGESKNPRDKPVAGLAKPSTPIAKTLSKNAAAAGDVNASSPVVVEEPVSRQYRGLEEVPTGEAPPELSSMIAEALALLDADKYDEFADRFVDPRDRDHPLQVIPPDAPPAVGPNGAKKPGAKQAAAKPKPKEPQPSPFDALARGPQRLALMLRAIGEREPHLFENGAIAVFDVGPRSRPTFVRHEGKWLLSRGAATHMDRRFAALAPGEEAVYLLEITTGRKAVSAADGKREGAEAVVVEKLRQMGAALALSPPGERPRRSAVVLTAEYRGGDAGFELLGQLNNESPIAVLALDGVSGVSEDQGWQELDQLTAVEYFRYTGAPALSDPLTIHLGRMEKLKTLIMVAGKSVGEIEVQRHLRRCVELERLNLIESQFTDSTLKTFAMFPALKSLDLEGPADAITADGAKELREQMPALWVDY